MSGSPNRTLSEFESKQLLERHGVAVAPQRLAATSEEAVAAASDLGFPVVVKLAGAAIAHKTERGLVRLGLPTPDAVAAAAADLLAAARPDDGEVACSSRRWCADRASSSPGCTPTPSSVRA